MNKTGQCSWHLKAPVGRRIKLKIAYFRTEIDFPCFYDYIQLYEDQSKTRDMLRRFCEPATQHSFQPEVYSTGQDIIVTYRFREKVEKAEFVAVFENVSPSEGNYSGYLFFTFVVTINTRDLLDSLRFSFFFKTNLTFQEK